MLQLTRPLRIAITGKTVNTGVAPPKAMSETIAKLLLFVNRYNKQDSEIVHES